jgi:hypothetical protein
VDAACPEPDEGFTDRPRVAETFRALRSGQLTSASVELHSNDEGADFAMEIWSVNQTGQLRRASAGVSSANTSNAPSRSLTAPPSVQ